MAEKQFVKIRSIYGDIRGLLSQIPQPDTDPYVSAFLVNQYNTTIDELSHVTDTDYSRYKVTDEARVPRHSRGPHYYSKAVRPQMGRVISRLEEEYGYGGDPSPSTTAKNTMIEDLEHPHREYLGLLHRNVKSFFKKHKPSTVFGVVILIALLAAGYFGLVTYEPEFSFPIGTFTYNSRSTGSVSTLNRSIFNFANEVSPENLTSQQRVDFVSKLTGLKTQQEHGVLEDVGTDGRTLLIRGSDDGSTSFIRCGFTNEWMQRLGLLEKGEKINFSGTISSYDLSREWIVLKDCSFID